MNYKTPKLDGEFWDRRVRLGSGTSGKRKPLAVVVADFVFALVVAGASMAVLAQDTRPYGPITGDDFAMEAPNPRPIGEHGKPLKAKIETAIVVETDISSTHKSETPGGAITITTAAKAKVSTEMLKDRSWIEPALKADKELLDHEQGHLDVTEKHTLRLQAKYNKKQENGEFTETKVLPPGTSDSDRDKAIAEQQARVQRKIDELIEAQEKKNAAEQNDYDHDTDHGEKGKEQKAKRAAQRDALKNPNIDSDQKRGAELKSKSGQSIKFDSLTGLLTLDEDFVIGIDPLKSSFVVDPLDPVLGSLVILPAFSLLGEQSDGTFFFGALGASPQVEIVSADGEQLFSAILPYLVYDPAINLLFGLGGHFDVLGGRSAYVDHLLRELTGNELALFGIEFRPDIDFGRESFGFTVDASSSFTNGAGARSLLLVPEPATSSLLALGLLVLVLRLRWRTKRAVIPPKSS